MSRAALALLAFFTWGAFAQESTPNMVSIYRPHEQGVRHEIPVDTKLILTRKAPDVTLQARDILYVPDNNEKKNTTQWLDRITGFGSATAAGTIIYRH